MTQAARNHIYKLATAVTALLLLVGAVAEADVQKILAIVAAVLNIVPLVLAIRFSGKGVDVVPVDDSPVDADV